MKDNIIYKFIVKFTATGAGMGYFPIAPGTAGSLLGAAIFFSLKFSGAPVPVYLYILGAIILAGIISAGRAEILFNKKDSRFIVIDEAAGAVIYLCLIPYTIGWIIAGFIIYRILDIIKPFPAGASERLPGGWGIMADDIICGIYTALIIKGIIWANILQ